MNGVGPLVLKDSGIIRQTITRTFASKNADQVGPVISLEPLAGLLHAGQATGHGAPVDIASTAYYSYFGH